MRGTTLSVDNEQDSTARSDGSRHQIGLLHRTKEHDQLDRQRLQSPTPAALTFALQARSDRFGVVSAHSGTAARGQLQTLGAQPDLK
jgi:hypothetical protein